MFLRTSHHTRFSYPAAASQSHNEIRLRPLDDEFQHCVSFDLHVSPTASIHHYREPGGVVHHFALPHPHEFLEIEAHSVVETSTKNPFDGLNLIAADWHAVPALANEAAEFLAPTRYVPYNTEVVTMLDRNSQTSVATFLIDLNRQIHDWLTYDPDVTHVMSTLEDVLRLRAGVCQDFAHLMLACARSQGIPSRYVSGYLYVGGSEGLRGELATHAWVECLLPEGRWIGLDPTNNLLTNGRYVRIHTGRDYADVAPVRGIYHGLFAERMDVKVFVESQDAVAS